MKKPRLLKPSEIEVRVGRVVEGKGITCLLYKTARTDMDILDETYGAEHWSNSYREIKGVLYCTITIDGVSKEDCGTESNTEAQKGESSDAFKRAGFRWGIGRELYTSPFIWIPMEKIKTKTQYGKIVPDIDFTVQAIDYEDRKVSYLRIYDGRTRSVVFEYGKPNKVKNAEELPSFEEQMKAVGV